MGDVVILEAAQHLEDRIDASDGAEKLVAEPLALARSPYQTGDVDHLELGLDDLFRLRDPRDFLQPMIGHRHAAGIGLDGAERIIGGGGRLRRGQRIEEGRLTDIGQADDTTVETQILDPRSIAVWRCLCLRGLGHQGDLVHEAGIVPFDQKGAGRDDRIQERIEPNPVIPAEIAEHVTGYLGPVARMADAQPHPSEILRAYGGRDRAKAVMAGDATARLYPNLARRQIQLVMQNQDVVKGKLVEIGHLRHRDTRTVHEGLRFLQHGP